MMPKLMAFMVAFTTGLNLQHTITSSDDLLQETAQLLEQVQDEIDSWWMAVNYEAVWAENKIHEAISNKIDTCTELIRHAIGEYSSEVDLAVYESNTCECNSLKSHLSDTYERTTNLISMYLKSVSRKANCMFDSAISEARVFNETITNLNGRLSKCGSHEDNCLVEISVEAIRLHQNVSQAANNGSDDIRKSMGDFLKLIESKSEEFLDGERESAHRMKQTMLYCVDSVRYTLENP